MTAAKSWEFWPPWLFYAPVGLIVAALSARYGLRAVPAANPGLRDGGLVGESKAEILDTLPREWTIPHLRLPAVQPIAAAKAAIAATGWTYPLIVKPDVGQRGVGVKRVRDENELFEYLRTAHDAVLVQPWHPGPFEAGIFYARHPDHAQGRILSLTDKHFPSVVGDGRSTLAQLICRHPRFRRQAALFLRTHAREREHVLPRGERRVLGDIGNHARGAIFLDGAHLITPALEARIDAIARSIPGFFVGRFDVRYRDQEAFKAGHDLAIVELNGVTAESTDIYDPSRTLLAAYGTLYRQWRLIYEIGAANLAAGAPRPSLRRMASLVWTYLAS